MKKNILRQLISAGLVSMTLFFSHCTQELAPDYSFKITPETYSNTPISSLLYSQFIEIGFGYQIAPMQAERLFNRSFEEFVPYNGRTKNSFGLLLPDNQYIEDWSGESWYHSGYEHDSWYASPGSPDNPAVINDQSSHFILESEEANVSIKPIPGGSGHGAQSLLISNNEKGKWAGVAQDGKWLEKGKTYTFSGHLKAIGTGSEMVKLSLLKTENNNEVFFESEISISNEFQKYTVAIPYSGPTEKVTFALWIAPGSKIQADAFSLLPEDHFFKWKPETIETIKKLNPGLIRFPGGCFASFYDWRQGVGPYDERVPEPSYFWGGLNNNDLGTAEFAMMCREVGSEMMICINMFHPYKDKYLSGGKDSWQGTGFELPQFTDIDKGIQEAVDWLAYCNLKVGEHPMADLRAEHGFNEPFNVKYWEMDNETVRWMSANEYAELVVRYSKAMKALDPDIRIGMVTYDFTEHVPEMIQIAGKHIDFFADRDDSQDGRLDKMLGILKSYNTKHGTDIKYCNTEWQVHPYGSSNPKEEVDQKYLYGHKTKIKRSMVLGTWYCGLKAAGYLMDWQRKGSAVGFVNYNNFSNTHGQAVIETPKEGAYLTAPGKLYELISRTPAKRPLKIDGYSPALTDILQAQAAYSMNRDSLILYTLNKGDTASRMAFDLSGLDVKFRKVSYSQLDADDIFSRTKIDLPDEIRRKDWDGKTRKQTINIECLPRSFTQVVLSR